jgi:hypothetical protein
MTLFHVRVFKSRACIQVTCDDKSLTFNAVRADTTDRQTASETWNRGYCVAVYCAACDFLHQTFLCLQLEAHISRSASSYSWTASLTLKWLHETEPSWEANSRSDEPRNSPCLQESATGKHPPPTPGSICHLHTIQCVSKHPFNIVSKIVSSLDPWFLFRMSRVQKQLADRQPWLCFSQFFSILPV